MSSASGHKPALPALTLAALGIVYGDIGTSPLYTLKECFSAHTHLTPTVANVTGILSLIFWSIIVVVTLKYISFVLRADNKGEGGILTLAALAGRKLEGLPRSLVLVLGLLGAGLFFGEVVITPAISVLSAVEGLEVVAPELDAYVLPLALGVLIALFLIQKSGTAKVGAFFGPIMGLWFLTLGALGVLGISKQPAVLQAVNPMLGLSFLADHGWASLLALGSVVLALTGAEALYADMGHFGRKPIRYAWFGLVLPALLLNYFGQGAHLLSNPEAVENPFFHLAPDWATMPLVALATAATVIASQAVISGVFSLTRQAIQQGLLSRLSIQHTSDHEIGQIYIPGVNWALLGSVIIVVLAFQNSSALAAAYGIAVTGTMIITSILACTVARRQWGWPLLATVALLSVLLVIDVPFFVANVLKLFSGGWLPLVIGLVMFVIMSTWRRGRELLFQRLQEQALPLDSFIENLETYPPTRVQGTAVFLNSATLGVPHALLHNLKHNKVLHERIVLMTVQNIDEPYVKTENRVQVIRLSNSFWQVVARYGFKEVPNVPEILDLCAQQGLEFEPMDTSFFLSRETLISTDRPGMARWREKLFVLQSKNALRATDFFQIPANRVVEMGTQVEL
jgi:KUP system potassium uptake protein